jgi:hypothetical protein
LFLFAIGREGECLIKEKDYGVGLSLKRQEEKQYSIQEILVIVMFSKKLDKYLEDLIYASYQLGHINQDSYLWHSILIQMMQ